QRPHGRRGFREAQGCAPVRYIDVVPRFVRRRQKLFRHDQSEDLGRISEPWFPRVTQGARLKYHHFIPIYHWNLLVLPIVPGMSKRHWSCSHDPLVFWTARSRGSRRQDRNGMATNSYPGGSTTRKGGLT